MKLGIYGAGGLGKEIYELAKRCSLISGRWEKIVFIDDYKEEESFFGTDLIRFETLHENREDFECIVGVGEPIVREILFNKLVKSGLAIATIIDPSACCSAKARIGQGTIICEFGSIHADVVIGDNCLIQPYCLIGHDSRIGSHSVLSPHFTPGGGLVLGNRVFAGMNSSIKEYTTVGDDVIIAMGAAVFSDLPSGVTVVGNPSRITKGRDSHRVF